MTATKTPIFQRTDRSRYGGKGDWRIRLGRLGSIRLDRHPYGKKGFWLQIQLGKGAGYRWLDFPGYSQSIYAPWYRSLSIRGRTLVLASHVRAYPNASGLLLGRKNQQARFYATGLSTKCNRPVYPGWY